MLDSFVYLMGSYVPVTSLLVMFVLGLCGYICYLTGYRKAIADFPVDDVEHDVSLAARFDAMAEDVGSLIVDVQRLDELEQQGFEERLDELEQQGFEERLDALEEQGYKEGYDRSPGSYWERLDELERVNTKTEFDKRVEASIPFSSWALRVKDQRAIDTTRLDKRINNIEERLEQGI